MMTTDVHDRESRKQRVTAAGPKCRDKHATVLREYLIRALRRTGRRCSVSASLDQVFAAYCDAYATALRSGRPFVACRVTDRDDTVFVYADAHGSVWLLAADALALVASRQKAGEPVMTITPHDDPTVEETEVLRMAEDQARRIALVPYGEAG